MREQHWLHQLNQGQGTGNLSNSQTSFQHLKASPEQNNQPGKANFITRLQYTWVTQGSTI